MDSDFDVDESTWNQEEEDGEQQLQLMEQKKKRKQWLKPTKPKVSRCSLSCFIDVHLPSRVLFNIHSINHCSPCFCTPPTSHTGVSKAYKTLYPLSKTLPTNTGIKADCKGNNGENGCSVQGLVAKVKDTVAND